MEIAAGAHVTSNIRLVQELGRGGMGSVWTADHLGLGTQVAVKFITKLDDDGGESLARFRREAKVASQIKSPHVVQMFDYGVTSAGTPYMVMELLEGESLRDRLQREGHLSLAHTAKLVEQVAQVLAAAHQIHVVHRDIKPGNIFLVATAYDLFVKVLDFGIAKRVGLKEGVTASGALLGTPRFMSPESIGSSRDIDWRADLWALAAVAYEAMLGRPAFAGDTLGSVISTVVTLRYTPPSLVAPAFAPFDSWFARAFHADVSQRFQSAAELAQSFQALAAGQATWSQGQEQHPALTQGGGTTSQHRATAPASKGRGWLLALGALVVGALVSGGVYLSQTDDESSRASSTTKEKKKKKKKNGDASAPADDPEPSTSVSTPTATAVATTARAPNPAGTLPRVPPAAASSTATASADTSKSRSTFMARNQVRFCWFEHEGNSAEKGSSAVCTVTFSGKDSVSNVSVGGPAAAFAKFRSCATSRLANPSLWKDGDAPSVTFTESLPAPQK